MKKIFILLKPFLTQRKRLVFCYLILTTVLGICSLANPLLNGWFIDSLLTAHDMYILGTFIVITFALTGLNILISFLLQRLFTILQSTIAYELNCFVLTHISKLPLSYILKNDPVYLSQVINGDANNISSFSITVIQDIIINFLKFFIPFVIFAKINIFISFFLIILSIIYYFVFRQFKVRLYNENKELSEIKSEFFSALCEPLVHAKFYKLWESIAVALGRVNDIFKSVFSKSLQIQKLNWSFLSSDKIISSIAQTVVFVAGGYLVICGNLTIGNLTILLSYFGTFIGAVKYFYSFGGSYQGVLVSYARLNEHLLQVVDGCGNETPHDIKEISLMNLCFKYNNQSNYICYPNIRFERGKIYAISGSNGSGKTTLASLLCGLYAIEGDGSIVLNGIDIKCFNYAYLRQKKIAYADQEAVIINDTILNNILLGNEGITADEILSLNRKLKFFDEDDFLTMVKSTQKTPNLSTKLSGGERQKISLLRVLLKKPDLLILDEPTSFLDQKSICSLLDYLKSEKAHRITLLITHSDTVKDICDMIYSIMP